MVSILLTIGALAMVGIIAPLIALSSESNTYGSQLEEYIVSKNPQDTADIERLARDYQMASSKRYLWLKLNNSYGVSLKRFNLSRITKQARWNDIHIPHEHI